jgi:hypothetical protein
VVTSTLARNTGGCCCADTTVVATINAETAEIAEIRLLCDLCVLPPPLRLRRGSQKRLRREGGCV